MEGTLLQLLFWWLLDSEPYTDMRVPYPSILYAVTVVAVVNDLMRGMKLSCLWENVVDEPPPRVLNTHQKSFFMLFYFNITTMDFKIFNL